MSTRNEPASQVTTLSAKRQRTSVRKSREVAGDGRLANVGSNSRVGEQETKGRRHLIDVFVKAETKGRLRAPGLECKTKQTHVRHIEQGLCIITYVECAARFEGSLSGLQGHVDMDVDVVNVVLGTQKMEQIKQSQ